MTSFDSLQSATTIPHGFCHCGCGQQTRIATQTNTTKNIFKGRPLRFIQGHSGGAKKGKENKHWKGIRHKGGYIIVHKPEHPRADQRGYVPEHVLIAEAALGHYLPKSAIVHHANGTRDSGPLVICQDHAYHLLLHQRQRAYDACGHTNWRKCPHCKQYDSIENLKEASSGSFYHPDCAASYYRNWKEKRNEQH